MSANNTNRINNTRFRVLSNPARDEDMKYNRNSEGRVYTSSLYNRDPVLIGQGLTASPQERGPWVASLDEGFNCA